MAELSHDAKVRLVTLLAQFSGPSRAAELVSAEFAVTVDRRTAWKFDASKRGCTSGPRYRQLFKAVRERWLDDVASIAIAQRGHRLRVLDRLASKLEAAEDYSGVVRVLEQAAREVGGWFEKSPAQRRTPPRHGPLDCNVPREALVARLHTFIERERPSMTAPPASERS